MRALPKPVRLGLLTLRQALLAKDVPTEAPLCEALWEMAHGRPATGLDIGESLTDAALWVERAVDILPKNREEPIRVVGFEPDESAPGDEPLVEEEGTQ